MSNIQVFNEELPDFLRNAGVSALTKQLVGNSTPAVKRIVPKNGIFRKVVGGEDMGKLKGDLNVVIVGASPKVGRIFYAKQWSPDAEPTAPDCFSNNGQTPDEKAANPQSARCDDCTQNIKGSGMNNSKACRYSRRLAVVLEHDFDTALQGSVYQINLSSKSLFGESPSDNTHMFENYSKYMGNNGRSLDYTVTQLSFNEDNDNQSLLFTPIRHIKKFEYEVTSKASADPATQKMVIMTPYQADASGKAPRLEAPKVEVKKIEEAEEVEEVAPKKRESKKVADPVVKEDLDDVLDAWTKGD
jgi:hypothetical protein